MSVIDTLIIDRTQYILDRVKNNEDYFLTSDGERYLTADGSYVVLVYQVSKAYYNHTDFNRVESALAYLRDRLNVEFGFALNLTIKTDWTRQDLGQLGAQSLMEQYRQNVVVIRGAITQRTWTPLTPDSMRFLDWSKANDIEKILQDVEWLLDRMPFAWRHSGAAISGQGGLIGC